MKESAKRDVESVNFTELLQYREIEPCATTTIKDAERLFPNSFKQEWIEKTAETAEPEMVVLYLSSGLY